MLWFVKKGDTTATTRNNVIKDISDVFKSEPVDKTFHEWEQATVEADCYIRNLTIENQTVLDPFLGGGTTAIAALKLNRKFIGIEIDEDSYNIAKGRIANFLNTNKKQHLNSLDR